MVEPEVTAELDDPAIGTRIAERYEVTGVLGEGGMGRVYRAHHAAMKRDVAIKVLTRELVGDAQALARFEREMLAANKIHSEGTVKVFDFGPTGDGGAYLVMELVEGRTLSQVVAAEGALEPARVAGLGIQLAKALEAAHGEGIVHRDLKPSNVMLRDDGRVTVLDFGIAALGEDHGEGKITRTGAVLGSPAYLSPEQARGESVDHRADLYALGAILYEALCGSAPFSAPTTVALLYHQAHTEPDPLRKRVATVPRWLDDLVLELLAKNPDDRPQTATELAARLAAGEGYRRPRRALPRWLIPAAAGVAILAGAVGLGIALSGGDEVRAEELPFGRQQLVLPAEALEPPAAEEDEAAVEPDATEEHVAGERTEQDEAVAEESKPRASGPIDTGLLAKERRTLIKSAPRELKRATKRSRKWSKKLRKKHSKAHKHKHKHKKPKKRGKKKRRRKRAH